MAPTVLQYVGVAVVLLVVVVVVVMEVVVVAAAGVGGALIYSTQTLPKIVCGVIIATKPNQDRPAPVVAVVSLPRFCTMTEPHLPHLPLTIHDKSTQLPIRSSSGRLGIPCFLFWRLERFDFLTPGQTIWSDDVVI